MNMKITKENKKKKTNAWFLLYYGDIVTLGKS